MLGRLESRTRGLFAGPGTLTAPQSIVSPLVNLTPGRDWRRTELIVGDPVALSAGLVTVHHTVSVRSRESGELVWCRPFASRDDALAAYLKLIGLDLERAPDIWRLPSTWLDGELAYYIATVTTFNASLDDSANDWAAGGTKCPADVSGTDYLLIAGGGGGGKSNSGGSAGAAGGGAGGYRESNASVTAGVNYPVTIGGGGAGATSASTQGANGSDSTWNSLTSTGGGGGGGGNVSGTRDGLSGGSGGGAGWGSGSGTAGTGTVGQGNNGGGSHDNGYSGGGGGASAVGGTSTSTQNGHGGSGTASSITGSSVTRGGGGGAGKFGSATEGSGGAGGGGGGGPDDTSGTAGTANLGGGGGGAGRNTGNGGNGGSGVLILNWVTGAVVVTGGRLIQSVLIQSKLTRGRLVQ